MVSVCLPSDALLQTLPSYLGFSYLGRGVSLHGCSSKAQLLLLTSDAGSCSRPPPNPNPHVYMCSVVSDSLWPHGPQPARLLCPWDSPRQEHLSGVPFPTPGIFLTQEWKLRLFCLLHWQAGSLPLNHLGSPLQFLLVNIWTTFPLGRDFLSNKSFPNPTGRS